MPKESILYLFVYGSLRSGFPSTAYNYVSKYFTLIGLARTKGLLIDLGDYPVAVVTDSEKYISGELYKINNKEAFDFVIAQLDDYEGVNVTSNETQLYYRTVTEAIVEGKSIQTWVYWYKGDVTNKPIVESGDVMQYLMQKQKQ